jgi:hypothetical protein
MSNNLVINFYKEQMKNMFKNLKENDIKIEFLENRIKILEEFIKKNIGEHELKLLDMQSKTTNNFENLEMDPFILSMIHFLE